MDYKVEIPASDTWLKLSTRASTRGLVSSTIVLTAEKNNSGNTRFSHVKVTDGKSGVSSTITVKQDITPYIEIDKKEFNLDEFGGEVKVTVTSNIDVNVQFSDDWVSSAGTTDKSDFNFIQKIKAISFRKSKLILCPVARKNELPLFFSLINLESGLLQRRSKLIRH